MRQRVRGQEPLVPVFVEHVHAEELAAIGRVLDACPELERLVQHDLLRGGVAANRGRPGMTAAQVLRIVVLKQMRALSYDALAFHLSDSQSYRAFCRLGILGASVKKSTLQENVSRISPRTWEQLNAVLVAYAKQSGVETGEKTRVDCTAVETNVHAPTDSSLLMDTVRVLSGLIRRAADLVDVQWSNHRRRAKRRAIAILRASSADQRRPLYIDLLKVTEMTIEYAEATIAALKKDGSDSARGFALNLERIVALGKRVIDQTHRRVVLGESVPAAQKVTSIAEPHTDIIVKSRDEVIYGHKVCLNVGASGVVVDCVVHEGNPADVTLTVPIMKRHAEAFGAPPKQVVFDGAFASRANLAAIKDLGAEDVVFTKSQGIRLHEMASSTFVFRALRRFRAGVEGCISFLKRCFGLERCTWRGFPSFNAYVQASVFSANVLLIARHLLR